MIVMTLAAELNGSFFLSDARIKPLHGATFVLIICERAARNINNVFFILCDDKKMRCFGKKSEESER